MSKQQETKTGARRKFLTGAAAATADVLQRALAQLRVPRCTLAVGPMDGNTWRPYRFVVEPGTVALDPGACQCRALGRGTVIERAEHVREQSSRSRVRVGLAINSSQGRHNLALFVQ